MASRQPPLDVTEELTELMRDLHQLLQSYAPAWYEEEMDVRMRKVLAAADLTLHSLRQPGQESTGKTHVSPREAA